MGTAKEKFWEVDKPVLSVVIPVYNSEAFLEKTVGSVEVQTVRNLEILLVDDGSQDGSLALCEALQEADDRIRVFHRENGGAAAARNVGIREAKGRYIGFVDSDDLIYPDMYEKMIAAMELLETRGAGRAIVQIGREEVDEEGRDLPPAVVPPNETAFVEPEKFAESLLLYTGDASFCTSLLPASLMKGARFPEGKLGEDFRLLMEMVPVIDGVLRLPDIGYRVIHRRGSATRRSNPSQFSKAYVDIVEHADYCEEELTKTFPALKRSARRFGLYEREDYLLHVPIQDMNRKNEFYRKTLRYLRKNFFSMLGQEHLSRKDKLYLTLLTWMPKKTRQIHWALRKDKILADKGMR